MDKNLLITIVIFIGLSFFMFMLFLYVIKRDKVIEKKFAAFELSLEELNKEIFMLKKHLGSNDYSEKLEKIERIIESIVDDVRAIENKNLRIIEKLKEDIENLKIRVNKKSLSEISNVISKSDEEKVIALYKNGYSIEDISKELRIPAGEIELILKFASL